MIPGSSQTSGRVALGRIWTERKRKNYNSQRPTRVTQHQTRGRQRPGLETDADRRVFPYIHVDFARSREEVTDRKLRDHGHEPGSGAHRQKTGQNGAQEEHGEGQLTGSTFICSNRGTFWMNDQPGCVWGGGHVPTCCCACVMPVWRNVCMNLSSYWSGSRQVNNTAGRGGAGGLSGVQGHDTCSGRFQVVLFCYQH